MPNENISISDPRISEKFRIFIQELGELTKVSPGGTTYSYPIIRLVGNLHKHAKNKTEKEFAKKFVMDEIALRSKSAAQSMLARISSQANQNIGEENSAE